MGHLDSNRNFVSDFTTPEELKDARDRALWLAERHFSSKLIESFDLGNLISGYMTAEISTSYRPGERRIWFYIDNRMVHTMRCEAGQGVRRQAQEFFNIQIARQRELTQAPSSYEMAAR